MKFRKMGLAAMLITGALVLSGCGGGGELAVRDVPQMKHPVYDI